MDSENTTTNHHYHHRLKQISNALDDDEETRTVNSCHRVESPLIAVPFKWETQPGIPIHETEANKEEGYRQYKEPVVHPLPPPPRLTMLSNGKKNAAATLNSPRSPRSVSLSKKMKSLLQGKLGLSSPRKSSSSPTSVRFPPEDESLTKYEEPFHIGKELDELAHQPHAPVLPFQNMSNMLMELWYSKSGEVSAKAQKEQSDSSSELESPTSSMDTSVSNTDISVGSFSSDSSSSMERLPIRDSSCYYDIEDDGRYDDLDDDEDFSMEFVSSSSREFFAKQFYYKATNRFHVDSSESASLLDERSGRCSTPPLPSALKKHNKNSKCFKKVRFAEDTQFEDEECESPSDIPVLSRHSAEESEIEEDFSPSPRIKRDLSELLMHIIQTDMELNKKQNKGALKSMFRSKW